MHRQIVDRLLFANPTALPLHSIDRIATAPVLVVAPHPDDETLGCGGAIALLCSLGCQVNVLVISDGTMSHPRSRKYPAPILRALREVETRIATVTLGLEKSAVTFLNLPDGAIPTPESPDFPAAMGLCRDRIAALAPKTIFLPCRSDPHPDHRATWQLIHTALTDLPLSPRSIEYPIWDWDEEQRSEVPEPNRVTAWRLDISQVVEKKKSDRCLPFPNY